MKFLLGKTANGSSARLGQLDLPHGKVETPVFMPVATRGAVKTLAPWELKEAGAQLVLSNTYHLHIRPGEKLIKDRGGISQWMSWSGPTLTDSGGYQAYSLAREINLAKTTDKGVKFSSYLDGRSIFFTPQEALRIQLDIGSDIAMILDDCPAYPAKLGRLEESVQRTASWAKQSIDYWYSQEKLSRSRGIFGIVQGGTDAQLRLRSLADIQNLPFDGIAIGGLPLGGMEAKQSKQETGAVIDLLENELDKQRPHYLMGVGDPVDLIRYIHRGIDMFDCVLPTRLGRHGGWWTKDLARWNIRRQEFSSDSRPLDEKCSCPACRNFSRSYIRHLFIIQEPLAARLLTGHNLRFIFDLLKDIREAIEAGEFVKRYQYWLK